MRIVATCREFRQAFGTIPEQEYDKAMHRKYTQVWFKRDRTDLEEVITLYFTDRWAKRVRNAVMVARLTR